MNEKENKEIKNSDLAENFIHGLIAVIDSLETEEKEKETPKQPMPKNYTKIEKRIHEMLVENTGISILDSGMEYGRHWQQNRLIKDFRKLPILEYEIDQKYKEISFSLNIFHFLTKNLVITKESEKLNKEFQEFSKTMPKEYSWLMIIEEFLDYLKEKGYTTTKVENSYNYENLLSQGIQFATFYKNKDDEYSPFIILQVHNGADIRGGYTTPQIFKIRDIETFISSQYYIYASCGCTSIYSDDTGYHWYDYNGNYDEKQNNNELPNYWIVKAKKGHEKLYCTKCKKEVKFYSELGF